MAEDLINKGCLLNKTNKLIYPNEQILDRKFEKDFIRGLIDGDGSLIITNLNNDKHKSFELSFTGTKDICLGILKYFNKNLKLIQRHPERNNDNFSFTIGGNRQVTNIVEDLYKDASIYLDRKYEKYLKMLEISREQQ